MKITHFWVVTQPSKISTLRDILFKADIKYMEIQFAGGLDADDVVGIWTTKLEAKKVAITLLNRVKRR